MRVKKFIASVISAVLSCGSVSVPAFAQDENLVNDSAFDGKIISGNWNFTDTGCWYRSGSDSSPQNIFESVDNLSEGYMAQSIWAARIMEQLRGA